MTKEALKLALEALEEYHYGAARIIIREALAQPVQPTHDRLTEKAFLHELAVDMGIPITELLQSVQGGDPEQEPTCPECKAVVLYECVACSSNNYPPKAEQEPVAWGVFEGNLHDMYFTEEDAQELARLKGTHAEVRPLYTTPPVPVQERNFCPRCGKRTADLTAIHTCTPPQEKDT